jgi:hypothetical protein
MILRAAPHGTVLSRPGEELGRSRLVNTLLLYMLG